MGDKNEPHGELMIRTLAMPAQTNPSGDIFGGWVVSQMDLAGSSLAFITAKSHVVTRAIESMSFIAPVKVGDFICCYAKLIKIGNTSMQIEVEAWVSRKADQVKSQVTEGLFTFLSVDERGRPIRIGR